MMNYFMSGLKIMMCGVLIVQLTGCGTLLYPERKGQRVGHLDAGVVILDGIGLLLFIVPGVIAFAVDFSNGTIYLPDTTRVMSGQTIKQVKFDAKHSSIGSIEQIIKNETGKSVKLDQDNIEVTKLKSINKIALL